MSDQKDYIADIMQKWYNAMDKERVLVQPKCATILGAILTEYSIGTKMQPRDIWAEALTIKGREFTNWYNDLSVAEKLQYEKARLRASEKHDVRNRASSAMLLKG